ncbi:hypothetical protein POTOM_039797 [Populus tomentosa]|uniref:DC-UbP/UBTD2 N-terminal domain-containing protein n=1 Tax=Populus tomentosa TaxID=118781 RepID=A0A8X8CJT9_POPTO|nr:hypothetical protein POTOM_039797 [Populus tomentosa]
MGCAGSSQAKSDGNVKKIRKPKPWKHPQPITKSQLMQMRDEFWDTAPHYGGRKGSTLLDDSLAIGIAGDVHCKLEIWDALRAAADAELSLAQAIVDSAGVIVQNADLTICYDERGCTDSLHFCNSFVIVLALFDKSAKYELPKYVLTEPTNLIRET